jgi:hypothetical protein
VELRPFYSFPEKPFPRGKKEKKRKKTPEAERSLVSGREGEGREKCVLAYSNKRVAG